MKQVKLTTKATVAAGSEEFNFMTILKKFFSLAFLMLYMNDIVFSQGFLDNSLWLKTDEIYVSTWLVTKCDVSELKFLNGLTNDIEDISRDLQLNYSKTQVDTFANLWSHFLDSYFCDSFKPSACASEKTQKNQQSIWQYHQNIDPNHLYYYHFELPDSSLLLDLVRKKKIQVSKKCPCELTKQGVIPLKTKANCSTYGFRLIAYYKKKPC